MTTPESPSRSIAVRTFVTVNVSPERAFRRFTAGIDAWWPREHHAGPSPMRRIVVEGGVGGRCYTEQEDGTELDWGTVLVWDPPRRLVLAWRIETDGHAAPVVGRPSEVEVAFTPAGDGGTRVELEHRRLER